MYKALLLKRDEFGLSSETYFEHIRILTPNPIELELETFSTECKEFKDFQVFAVSSWTLSQYFTDLAHWIEVRLEWKTDRRGVTYKAYKLHRVIKDKTLYNLGFPEDFIKDWYCPR